MVRRTSGSAGRHHRGSGIGSLKKSGRAERDPPTREVDQGEVVGRLLLPSNEEPTESVHPRVSALDDPSTGSSAEKLSLLLRPLSAPTDVALEPVGVTDLLHFQEIVPLVEADPLASPSRRCEGARIECTLDQLAIVAIRRGNEHAQRNPPPVNRLRLTPDFPRSVGLGPVRSPPSGAFVIVPSIHCQPHRTPVFLS